jgi:hypothetical protein
MNADFAPMDADKGFLSTIFECTYMPAAKPDLTIESLLNEAHVFSIRESQHAEPSLFGVTDGKAVGTYIEHKFRKELDRRFRFEVGNSASGIDFPGLCVDMKVTSIRQPQSSCPFKSARQKVFGLGYSLLVFVYDKSDIARSRKARLDMKHVIFVEASSTADYQTTVGLRQILSNRGNAEDLIAFMRDRNLPLDEIEAAAIADELLAKAPMQGCLTISNALQWRLQYGRAIQEAGVHVGIRRVV